MRNLWIVIRHEILTTLGKPSFWVMSILFPLFMMGMNLAPTLFIQGEIKEPATSEHPQGEAIIVGLVDQAGLVKDIPPSIPDGQVRALADLEIARQALANGTIDQVIYLPSDFAATGRIEVTMRDFNPLGQMSNELVQYLLAYNLTGDEALAGRLMAPTAHAVIHRTDAAQVEKVNPLAGLVPYATLFLFFFLLTMSSGWMLQSVSREKLNRTAEVLLLSLDPRELMLGKILGLSVVAFLQMFIWVGGGMLLLGRGVEVLQMGAGLELPPAFLWASVVYFALGYLLYASLMGAVGALAPDLRNAGNFTFYIILPLMAPLLVNTIFSSAPGGTMPVVLSLFPLTAPSSMLTRLAVSSVPVWQVMVSLGLLALTTIFVVNLSARAFRADTLLSSEPLNWQRVKTELGAP